MQHAFEHGGPDPREVGLAIVRAATDRRPKLRYPVGKDARLIFALKRILPERRFERVMAWIFHKTMSRPAAPAAQQEYAH